MELSLEDKIAVVTGSSSGIGRQIARQFSAEGARVVVVGRDEARVAATVAEIEESEGEALGVCADVGLEADVERLFDAASSRFGRLDVVVNCAAWVPPRVHLLELDDEHWERALRTNLTGAFRCSRRAAQLFVEQGHGGALVAVTSLGASVAHRMMAAYDASKGGLEAFTRAAALDLAPFRIRVNAVCPGWIRDEDFGSLDEDVRAQRAGRVPLGRLGLAGEVAAAVVYLASERASYITGQVLRVDGGLGTQLRSPSEDVGLPERLSSSQP